MRGSLRTEPVAAPHPDPLPASGEREQKRRALWGFLPGCVEPRPSSALRPRKLAGARRGAPSPHISRPVSRVLCGAGPRHPARDDHSSGTPVARRLEQPTRTAGSGHRSRAVPPLARRRPRRPYSVLLPVGFAVPPALPSARCALTAPFHPCRGRAMAVCFLWHFPWGRPRRTLSGTACPWSPDFPPRCRGGRPAD